MDKFIKNTICFSLIFFTLFFTGCGSQYLGGDRNIKWKKDLSYLQKALPKKHVNLFFKISEEKFNEEINTLKNSVDNLNDDEIVNGIYKIIASVGDTHTSAYKKSLDMYPLQFYYFKEGIYVTNTISKYKDVLYSKLIRINGIDVKKVEQAILPLVAKDNEAMLKKSIPKYLMNAEVLHGLKIVSNTKEATFTFKNEKGRTFDINIDTIDMETFKGKFIIDKYNDTYPLYMQKSNLNYWYKYISSEKTLYFKYNKCLGVQESNNEKAKNMEEFTNELLKFMDNHPIHKFIIDMRDNSGGSDKYIKPFITWLKNKKVNNKNNLFIIVGRRTFSSAIVNAVMLKKETNATFVGESTSGIPNHYGAVKDFVLPNSKIAVQYSTQFNKLSEDNSNTFVPDKMIEVSIKDYLNKKDPVLDYILNYNVEKN
ncbi:peptidase S41 [Clostridium sp. KNHs214]|uniref:peptidase S41 n=1 Tax=Clostridium sp. KNHs214 TaxID=1540257 RepID=UPI00054DFBAA|nr:peptidase S41 [Clostridium sp. KNHs214]